MSEEEKIKFYKQQIKDAQTAKKIIDSNEWKFIQKHIFNRISEEAWQSFLNVPGKEQDNVKLRIIQGKFKVLRRIKYGLHELIEEGQLAAELLEECSGEKRA